MVFTIDTGFPPNNWSYRWSYRTEDGTATAGEDFKSVSGKLEFGSGESKKTISVTTLKDCRSEGDESLVLKLYDFQVKGLYRDVSGWVTPQKEIARGFPPGEWEMQGRVVDDFDPSMIGRALRGGC